MKSLIRGFFCITLLPLFRFIYRIKPINQMNIPATGGVLLIPNHVTYIDSFIIFASSPRPVRFMIVDHFTKIKAIGWFLKLFGAIPINKKRPKEAIRITAEAIKSGDVVCVFPEGQLTRTGVMNDLRKGFQLIARQADCPVVPVYMDGLWSSITSFERGKYFKKWPRRSPYPVSVAFGQPKPGKEATVEWAYQALLDLSEVAFANREKYQFSEPLEFAIIRALKKRPWKVMFVEHGRSVRRLKRNQVLATAIALSRRWGKIPLDEEQDRIGVLLPAGPAPSMINLALLLAGKTPVNVPFEVIDDDLAVAGFSSTLNELGVRTVITSKLFVPRLVEVWDADEGRFIDMAKEIRAAGAVKILFERIKAYFEPAFVTRWRLDLNKSARDAQTDEAIGLVPDVTRPAIFLTGAEVQRNAAQVFSADYFDRDFRIFSDLPLNSPEGTHLSLWAPLLVGHASIVSRSLSSKLNASLIEEIALEEQVDIICINGDGIEPILELESDWAKNAGESVRNVLVFGRDVTADEVLALEKKLGLPVCRGWASKIIGQVVSLSRPEPNLLPEEVPGPIELQVGADPASVGRLLPGFSARINRGYGKLFETGELSVKATRSIAEKVRAVQKERTQSIPEPDKKSVFPMQRTDTVESLNQPCWIVGAEKARFDEKGLLYLDEEAG